MLFKIIERIKKGGPNYRPLSVCEVRQGRNVQHCSSLKRGRPSRSCTFRQYVLQPLFFFFFFFALLFSIFCSGMISLTCTVCTLNICFRRGEQRKFAFADIFIFIF